MRGNVVIAVLAVGLVWSLATCAGLSKQLKTHINVRKRETEYARRLAHLLFMVKPEEGVKFWEDVNETKTVDTLEICLGRGGMESNTGEAGELDSSWHAHGLNSPAVIVDIEGMTGERKMRGWC